MARLSITGDSDLIEDQIQREAETHKNINSSPEKKKRRRSRLGKNTDEHHRGIFQDTVSSKDIDLGHDESMSFVIERDPLESSPSKKRKRNRHRDQSKLYEVPGVENLPAKRKTSYRVAQDLAADAIRGDSSDEPATAVHSKNASSYPEANPFMSPPKSLVQHASATQHASAANTSLKSPYAQKARLDTILKSCSRRTVEDAALDDLAMNNESGGSPSPPVKAEHEAQTISFRDIVRACDGKHGRVLCPIEGCEKSYTRKDSLSGHLTKSHSGQILRDNGDKTYSVVTQSKLTAETERNLKSACKEIQKHVHSGGNNNEDTRDKLAKKNKGKEENTTTRMKPLARNAPTELSAPATILPTVKSKYPDHDDEVERDSSASPVVVRPSLPPRSPKPIKPAVGNISGAKASYGSAMEEWEVSPGIVRAAVSIVKSGGHEVAYSAHHIRTNPASLNSPTLASPSILSSAAAALGSLLRHSSASVMSYLASSRFKLMGLILLLEKVECGGLLALVPASLATEVTKTPSSTSLLSELSEIWFNREMCQVVSPNCLVEQIYVRSARSLICEFQTTSLARNIVGYGMRNSAQWVARSGKIVGLWSMIAPW